MLILSILCCRKGSVEHDFFFTLKFDLPFWSRTHTFQKNCIICFIESPLKMMKNEEIFHYQTFLLISMDGG